MEFLCRHQPSRFSLSTHNYLQDSFDMVYTHYSDAISGEKQMVTLRITRAGILHKAVTFAITE